MSDRARYLPRALRRALRRSRYALQRQTVTRGLRLRAACLGLAALRLLVTCDNKLIISNLILLMMVGDTLRAAVVAPRTYLMQSGFIMMHQTILAYLLC